MRRTIIAALLGILAALSIDFGAHAQVNPVYRQDPVTGNATQQQFITVPAPFSITIQSGASLVCNTGASCSPFTAPGGVAGDLVCINGGGDGIVDCGIAPITSAAANSLWGNLTGTPAAPTFTVLGTGVPAALLLATSANGGFPTQVQAAPTSWTPTDGSGAGLTFTQATGTWVKIGRLCNINGTVQWPVNADGSAAKIASVPAACTTTSSGGGQGCAVGTNNVAVAVTLWMNTNDTVIQINSAVDGAETNTQVSNKTIRFSCTIQTNS